jgi:NAD(P)-dependent dehydrogenase (short-subunit alcohol dehydrogenase family)
MSGVIVVTGAARGIGRASAEALADRGTLLAVDLRKEDLDATVAALDAKGAKAIPLACDLGEPGSIEGLAAQVGELGGLQGLVHAAGLSGTMASAERIIEVNLCASARLVDALQPHVLTGAGAALLASQAGHLAAPGLDAKAEALLEDPLQADFFARLAEHLGAQVTHPNGAYGVSKRGVQLLAISRAPAWGARGGRIVSISPGIIDTQMGNAELDENRAAVEQLIAGTPIGARQGRPEEIAAVAAFICSEAASFITGVDLLVDGGSTHPFLKLMRG